MEVSGEYHVQLVICESPHHWYEASIILQEEEVKSGDKAPEIFKTAKNKWRMGHPKSPWAYAFLVRIDIIGKVPVPDGGLV